MQKVRIGLIGDNIAASKAPRLHALAGRMRGVEVTYDLLIPAEQGTGFDELFDHCATGDYHGINVTYPYKERAAARVRIDEPLVRAMGAVNTVVFTSDGPRGFNTDHTGFVHGVARGVRPRPAGPGLPGGRGRGRPGGRVRPRRPRRGGRPARGPRPRPGRAPRGSAPGGAAGTQTTAARSLEDAAVGARGIVNCSPVGMVGHDGTPVPRGLMRGSEWAFDAVYTPVDTRFLTEAAAAGLDTLSGYELFFEQGADCAEIFLGGPIDRTRLRQALQDPA